MYPSYLPHFSVYLLQQCSCFFLLRSKDKDFWFFYNQSKMIPIFKVEHNNGNRILKRPHQDLPIKSLSCCLACLSFPINLFLNSYGKNPFTVYIFIPLPYRGKIYILMYIWQKLAIEMDVSTYTVIRFLLQHKPNWWNSNQLIYFSLFMSLWRGAFTAEK